MATVIGTDIELIVIGWLDRHKIVYEFQSSLMGGFFELGGAVVDILFRERGLAWRIFGEYYHKGVQKTGADIIQKENLSAMGLIVVDIWSSDIESRLDETLSKALQGIEMLK